MWLEETLPQDNLDAYARLKEETDSAAGAQRTPDERWQFREVIERGLAQFANPYSCWCGGLTEARNIAMLAETAYVPVALAIAAARCFTRPACTWPRRFRISSSSRACAGTTMRTIATSPSLRRPRGTAGLTHPRRQGSASS